MEHPYHPDEGYASYMMTQASYEFDSTTRWRDTADVGNCFIVPATAIMDTDQKSAEIKWQEMKDLLDFYRNTCTTIQQIF